MLAGAQGAGRAEVDRGPAREPDVGRAGPPRARRRCRMAFDADGDDPRPRHRLRPGRRRLPDAVAGRHRRRGRDALPRPVPRAEGDASATKSVFTNTAGRTAYRGPWQFETLAREVLLDIAAREHGHRPGRAAPPQPAARATSCRTPTPTACPTTTSPRSRPSSRRSRCSTTTPSARSRPRRGPRAATSASGLAATSSRRRRGMGYYGHRGRDDPHRAHRARSTCTWPAARPATASRRRSCSSTADALGVDIEDVAHDPGRHRGHAVRRRDRRQPQRLDDRRRGRRDGRRSCASASSPSPPTSSRRAERHRARPAAAPRCAARRRSA